MTPQGRYNIKYVLLICAVSALGGLLFGYDTAVISGAIGPIKSYFGLDAAGVGWAVSNVAIGCIVGAFAAGTIAGRLGRKKALLLAALLFTVSAIGSALVETFSWFIVYRLIGGVAVGLASAVSPMYMSEVSPKDMRGRAIGMQNFAIVFGQVAIFTINYLIAKGASEAWLVDMGWRVMLGSEVIPCLLFCLVVMFIPESPRWNVMQGNDAAALATLRRIYNGPYPEKVLKEIKDSLKQRQLEQRQKRKLDYRNDKAFWFIAFVGCMIAILQQATGVNVMMYFAPVVLEQATGNNEAALFMTIWIGVVQLIGTSIGAFLMDRVGRVPLLRIGAIGSAAGLLMTSYFLYQAAGLAGSEAVRNGYFILSGMLLFMLFFAFSWAVGAWVVVSEIFPNRMRSEGMSLAIAAMWVSNFIIGLGFPLMNDNTFLLEHFNGAFPMWLFAGCCVLSYFFVTRFLPETKGVTLERMEETMLSKTRLEAKELSVEMARANG